MAVTENMLIDIQVKSGDAEKEVVKLGQEIELLNKKIALNNDSIKRSSLEFTRNANAINVAVNNYDKTKSIVKNTDDSVKKLNQSLAASSQTMVQYNSSTAMANTTIMKMSSNLRNLEMAVNSLTANIQFLIRSIKFFTDPKVLKNVADVSNVLGAVAYTKGMHGTANGLREIGKSFDILSDKSKDFRDNADGNLNDVVERARLINEVVEKSPSAFKVLSGALGLAAGDMVYSYSKAQNANKALESQILLTGETSKKTFSKLATDVEKPISGFSKMTAGARHSIAAVEALSLLSPVLIILGNKLKESENSFVSWGGKILKTIGLLSAGLMGFIGLAVGAFAGLSLSIGNTLLASTQEAMDKFIKFESVMAQFKFTIQGFTKVFGVDAVGSVEYWNKTMDQLYKNTVFTREELAKSIKLLVAEGQVIGLTVEDNTKLLDRAADVAAATGRDLYEVTQMIINGLTNNADAVLGLGIDIRNTSLAHSKYVEESGLAVEQMSAQELAMARLNALYEKTVPLIGAAANQTKTISGSNMIYQKTLSDISVTMGQAGTATELYNASINKFLSFIRDLPKPLINTYGNLKDMLGVTLVIIGQMLKLAAVVFAVSTAFKLLNFVLSSTWGITVSLSASLSFLGTVIAPIAAVVIALMVSMKELMETSKGFEDTVNAVTGSLFVFSGSIDGAEKSTWSFIGAINRLINIALLPFKIVLIAIAETFNVFAIAFINIKKIFTSNDATISEYNKKLNILWSRLSNLSAVTGKAFKALDFFSESSAYASGKTNELNQTQEKSVNLTQKFKDRVIKLATAINEGFDKGIERQKFLGNEFEKSMASFKQAQNELNNVFKTKSNDKEAAQKYADNERKVLQASLEIEKLRLDTIKKITEQRKVLETEMLRSQGRNIEAIRRERDDQLKAIDEQISGMKSLGEVRKEDIQALEQTRKLIENSSDIKVNEERNKSLQKALDAEKFLSDLKRENASLDKNIVEELKGRVELRNQEVKKMEEALKSSNDLYGRSKQAIAESKLQIDKMFDTGLLTAQKQLLEELNNKNKELNDSINKDQLTQYENINLTYEKEKELLEVKKEQLRAQGLLNGDMIDSINEQGDLLKKQRDISIKNAPGQEQESLEKVGTSAASSISGVFSSGALGMVSGAMNMVGAVVDVVDKILDFIPGMLNKIAGVFDKITQFPTILFNSVKNLGRAIVENIRNALPNLLKMLPDMVDYLITLIFEEIPDAIQSLVDSLPDLIQMLVDRIPVLVEKLVTSLIDSAPKMTISFIKAVIKLVPVLIMSYIKLYPKIISAIINGIVNGLKNIGNLFKGLSIKAPNMKKAVDSLKLGIKSASKTLTGEASKLFQVMDLGASDTTKDTLKDIPGNIEKGAKKAVDYLTMWWRKLLKELQGLWNGIVSVWKTVWNGIKNIWDEVIRALKFVFEFLKSIWDMVISLLKGLWETLKSIWDGVIKLLTTLWDGVKSLWDGIISTLTTLWDGVKTMWDGVISALSTIWDAVKIMWDFVITTLTSLWESMKGIWDGVTESLSKVWEKLSTLGTTIWDGLKSALEGAGTFLSDIGGKIWGGLKSAFEGAGNFLSDIGGKMWNGLKSGLDGLEDFFKGLFNKLNPANLFEKMFQMDLKGQGTVEKALNIDVPYANFARGGMVPGSPLVKGDSIMNDRILALLSPGEAVIPRSLMGDPAVKAIIDSILDGKINPMGLWGGSLSIGGKNIIGVSDKGISVGDTQISNPSDAWDAATNVLGGLWGDVKKQVFDMVLKMFEANKFHTGGLVPAFAGGGEVPAMLQPGEFVINRSSAQGLGLNFLNNMNKGGGQTSQPNITMNIQIETTQPIDESFFRNNLMPRIKDDIKRRTLNGEFIISSKGVR